MKKSLRPSDLLVAVAQREIHATHERRRVGVRRGKDSGHDSRIKGVRDAREMWLAGKGWLSRDDIAVVRVAVTRGFETLRFYD